MTTLTENVLNTMGCFFAAYQHGNSLHSFCYGLVDHRSSGSILVPLVIGTPEYVKALDMYDVARPAGYHPEQRLLVPRRSQKIYSYCSGGDDFRFLATTLRLGSCFLFHPYDIKRFKTGSGVIFDIPDHEF